MSVQAPAAFDQVGAAREVARRLRARPELLIVLGSGLSALADAVEDPVWVPFAELPGFPAVGVAGHAGRFVGGRLSGRSVLVQAGRFHLYEGHPPEVVCGPVRMAHHLGAHTLIATNAAGAVNPRLTPGSLMLLDDHLMLMAPTLLRGLLPVGGAPFLDMTRPYDPGLAELATRSAAELGIPLARGVYAAVSGPSYETPAEVRALARCGADAVGMSTAPEVVAARALGMSCLAISLITNMAAGTAGSPLSHDEVMEVGREAGARLGQLIQRIVQERPA